jgi:RNA polymerase sigma-70 factor, ECF subfamily
MVVPMAIGRETPADGSQPAPGALDSTLGPLESFRDRLRLFAARRLRDWGAAEDVAQEAISRALEALRAGRIENPEALPGFLFQTALHVCLRRIRTAGRERKALQKFGASGEREGGSESPLSAMLSAERRTNVLKALERLDSEDRQVLELTYRDELDTEDIGRRLGVTPGAVRVRRHRALKRLASALGVTRAADGVLNK